MRDETIKYCNIDCISLYQVINKFNTLIFNLFEMNIHKYPTLSSLAFAIFRTHFLIENTIPQISGQIAKDIRMSYTGGACDMYIPSAETKLYAYDVNSLYPSVMQNCDMPTGHPIFFKGDIRVTDPNAFGFFYCNIIAPDNLNEPIIQTHVTINKENIFKEYVDNLYELRLKYNKSDPLNFIAKLLLNSLYGMDD